MHVVIYGCGAIGSVLATFLNKASTENKNTIHLVGRKHFMNLIDEKGLIYHPYASDNEIHTINYQTHISIKEIHEADIVFLTMKAYNLKNSLKMAENWFKEINPFVVLSMNGLGLKRITKQFIPRDRIIEFAVSFPSRIENNHVYNSGGNSFFSMVDENDKVGSEKKEIIKKVFGNDHEPIRFDPNFKQSQWKKAIANIAMNGISAICMLTVGQVLDRKTLRLVLKGLIDESVEIARKLKVRFDEDVAEWFFKFAGH
ncbi:MAG: hypothetical protein GF364_17165, partial [Candidatus Lokiarchaeota archaeon]|nr:hypothetical protein [Candidatus Lokiarchaeota archaeon]